MQAKDNNPKSSAGSNGKHNSRSRNNHAQPREEESSANPGDEKQVLVTQKRRRRIYTDDSDLFLCALHSGWITWNGAAQARARGKDVKLELRVIRCFGVVGGAQLVEGVTGKEEVVGRFLGGYGERCFNDAGKAQNAERKSGDDENKEKDKVDEKENKDDNKDKDDGDDVGRQQSADEDDAEGDMSDSEDDGRGLASAAWGSGHDGSAIEVLGVEFVEVRLLP